MIKENREMGEGRDNDQVMGRLGWGRWDRDNFGLRPGNARWCSVSSGASPWSWFPGSWEYSSIGIFSDYPAQDKLSALEQTAQVVVSATCFEVNQLKSDPTGLLVAAKQLRTPWGTAYSSGIRRPKMEPAPSGLVSLNLILASCRKNCQFHRPATWFRDVA